MHRYKLSTPYKKHGVIKDNLENAILHLTTNCFLFNLLKCIIVVREIK